MKKKYDPEVEALTEQYREKSPKKLPLSDIASTKEFVEK